MNINSKITQPIKVVFFQRKPFLTGNYSLEFICDDIRKQLDGKIISTIIVSPFYSRGIWRRLGNIIHAFLNRGDVNFVAGDINYICLFLPNKRTILTIPDCGFSIYDSRMKNWLINLFWFVIPVHIAKYVITISPSSKRDIIKITSCNPEKISIIPVSINDQYRHYPKEFNNEEPILLQVGQAENKNVTRIIEAINGFKIKLHIIGVLSEKDRKLLKKNNIKYSNFINLTDEEMLQQYITADVLLFPSTFEGFGMPILEAQAVGRPVITSNLSSMPWVANESACLVDPFCVESIRNGVKRVICDEIYRTQLVALGLLNVKRFNKEAIVNQYYEIFEKVWLGK